MHSAWSINQNINGKSWLPFQTSTSYEINIISFKCKGVWCAEPETQNRNLFPANAFSNNWAHLDIDISAVGMGVEWIGGGMKRRFPQSLQAAYKKRHLGQIGHELIVTGTTFIDNWIYKIKVYSVCNNGARLLSGFFSWRYMCKGVNGHWQDWSSVETVGNSTCLYSTTWKSVDSPVSFE